MRKWIPVLFIGLLLAAHLAGCAAPPPARRAVPAAPQSPHLALNEQGNAAFEKGNFEEAASLYRDALKWAPNDAVLWGNLGNACFRMKKYDEAIRAYDRSLEITPRNGDMRARRGEALYETGRFREAVSDYAGALDEKELAVPEARRHLLRAKAFAHAGLGEIEAALAMIDKAREISSYDIRPDLALIHYALGDREKAWRYRGGRGMVGMEVQDHKKEGQEGALVVRTSENGPARRAAILDGDVVVRVNGVPVTSAADLVRLVATLVPETTARIGVLREGKPREIPLTVGSSEPLLESNPLIAPILAKRRIDGRAKPATRPLEKEAAPPAGIESAGEKLPPPRADAYAVVIGIDYTGRPDIPHLLYASEDARRIYELLTDPRYGGVPKENARLILNEKATRSELIAALRKIRTWDGYIYVFYSGHGAPRMKDGRLTDALLVPHDIIVTDPGAMEETGIRISYLRELVDDSRAKGVLVALDACFSGGGKSIVPQGSRPLVGVAISQELIKPKGAGKVILTSSALSQQSWEDESELKGGIFSHVLREGLSGRAGKEAWVTADALAAYVRAEVPRAARRLKGVDQEPQVVGTGSFPVARNWEKARFLDAERAKARLKTAFEQRLITDDQLNRALGELGRPSLSRTLEAFLEERIEGRNFGELY